MWFLLNFIAVLGLSPDAATPADCLSCKVTVKALQAYYMEPSHWAKWNEIAVDYCVSTGNYIRSVCQGAVDENSPIAIDSILKRVMNPEYLCEQIGSCSNTQYVFENFTQWVSTVMSTKPPGPVPTPTGRSSYTFAHMSDIHVDIFYQPGTVTDCDEPVCCRTGTGPAGTWGDYNCDLPVKTFEAALIQLKTLNPQFIIITGDMPPHDIWNQSDAYNMGYQSLASGLLKQYFPTTPVYAILGNHACFPVNQFSYEVDQEKWLLDGFAENWGWWLDAGAIDQLKTLGVYSMLHAGTNLRMIALNTQACNDQNFYLWVNSTDPGGQVVWLWQQLAAAEKNGEVVYMYGHYYLADDGCLKYWSYHINALIDRYEKIIAGTFFGHSHEDSFHINRGVYDNLPTRIQFVAPSITTYTDKNPSFRLYQADTDTKLVTNILQYRLDLPKANLDPTSNPTFDLAYDFKALYNVPDMQASTMYNLALNIANNQTLALIYLNNHDTGVNSPTTCDANCQHSLMCDITYGVGDQVDLCSGPPEPNWQTKLNDMLFPPWMYKVTK